MADVTISVVIPEAKVAQALAGFLKIYPNTETKPDPDWVDPQDGSEAPQIAKYSNSAWVREQVRRLIVRDVRRGLQMAANEEAQVAADDDLVS